MTNIDGAVVSWRFLELDQLPAVIITSPTDERLIADDAKLDDSSATVLRVGAKVWAANEVVTVEASLEEKVAPMQQIPGSRVWKALIPCEDSNSGMHSLRVVAVDAQGNNLVDNLPLGLMAGGRLQAAKVHGLLSNAVLISVDLGPHVPVTGSLATILWLLALRKEKLDVSF